MNSVTVCYAAQDAGDGVDGVAVEFLENIVGLAGPTGCDVLRSKVMPIFMHACISPTRFEVALQPRSGRAKPGS